MKRGRWSSPRCSSSSIAGAWPGGDLAEPEGVERGARGDQVDDLPEAAQIDRVLGEAARPEHPRGDAERAAAARSHARGAAVG